MRSPSKSVTKRVRDVESELNLPPGFRFHPTDEELIVHYLRRKSQSTPESLTVPPIIANVDLYKHDPWQLPEMALFGTTEWYFFTPRDRKYPNGSRPNRATGNGYWKATGADKHIKSKSDPNTTIGIKKSLVFYAGKGISGIKTNWIMHEYRLVVANPNTISKAAKILANLLVMGSGILVRGMVQAYKKAIQNAKTSGVAQETLQNAVRKRSKAMTEQEARQILGVTERSSWEEIAQKYDNLFERNATNGSFYLQSKVHRAKECLETAYQVKDQPGGSVG